MSKGENTMTDSIKKDCKDCGIITKMLKMIIMLVGANTMNIGMTLFIMLKILKA